MPKKFVEESKGNVTQERKIFLGRTRQLGRRKHDRGTRDAKAFQERPPISEYNLLTPLVGGECQDAPGMDCCPTVSRWYTVPANLVTPVVGGECQDAPGMDSCPALQSPDGAPRCISDNETF